MSGPSCFLGVDGGGTKTALAVVSDRGEVLAELRAPSCYYLASGITEGPAMILRVLGEAVPAVCAAAGVRPEELRYAFFGLPGYGEVSADLELVDRLPAEILGHDRYRCNNDMVCGWAGSLGLADGINIVAGTGSIAYGQRHGAASRVGGWGELIGDEGSAYWIGSQALRRVSRMVDGREPPGVLAELVLAELELVAPWDMVDVVHNRWAGDRARIAGLAPLVVRASEAGDRAARQVLDAAVAELLELVATVRAELGFDSTETVSVSSSGGVFSAAPVIARFRAGLEATEVSYRFVAPFTSPVLGAALYAASLAGAELDAAARQRLGRAGDRDLTPSVPVSSVPVSSVPARANPDTTAADGVGLADRR